MRFVCSLTLKLDCVLQVCKFNYDLFSKKHINKFITIHPIHGFKRKNQFYSSHLAISPANVGLALQKSSPSSKSAHLFAQSINLASACRERSIDTLDSLDSRRGTRARCVYVTSSPIATDTEFVEIYHVPWEILSRDAPCIIFVDGEISQHQCWWKKSHFECIKVAADHGSEQILGQQSRILGSCERIESKAFLCSRIGVHLIASKLGRHVVVSVSNCSNSSLS